APLPRSPPRPRRPATFCSKLSSGSPFPGWTSLSMRERPQARLLLADRPQPREAARLDDEEEDDQRAEDHGFDVRDGRGRDGDAQPPGQLVEEDRQQGDERRAEEAAEDRPQPADDHHEQQAER